MAQAGCRRRLSTWASRWGPRRGKGRRRRSSGSAVASAWRLATGAARSEPRGVRYPIGLHQTRHEQRTPSPAAVRGGRHGEPGVACRGQRSGDLAHGRHCHRTDGFDDHPVALAVGSAWRRRRRTTPPPCLSPAVIASARALHEKSRLGSCRARTRTLCAPEALVGGRGPACRPLLVEIASEGCANSAWEPCAKRRRGEAWLRVVTQGERARRHTLGFSPQVEGSSVRQPRAFQRSAMPRVASSKGGSGLRPAK